MTADTNEAKALATQIRTTLRYGCAAGANMKEAAIANTDRLEALAQQAGTAPQAQPLHDFYANGGSFAHLATQAQPLAAGVVEALRWYGEEAAALARHTQAKNDKAMLACVTVLSLDAGRRAADALAHVQEPEYYIKGTQNAPTSNKT